MFYFLNFRYVEKTKSDLNILPNDDTVIQSRNKSSMELRH